jgi:hypothetical protein
MKTYTAVALVSRNGSPLSERVFKGIRAESHKKAAAQIGTALHAEGLETTSISVQEAKPARSNKPEVRNPVLKLPAIAQFKALPPEARAALIAMLRDLSTDARGKAEKSWRTNKAPMAAYWKAVAVYARHLALAAR